MTPLDAALQNLPPWVRGTVDRHAAAREFDGPFTANRAPRLYQVETTARCNLACPFCPRTTDLVPNQRRDLEAELPLSVFEVLLDQMPGTRSLELFHFGEPFMQASFWRYVKACTERGIFSVAASNLLPATPEKVDRVFEAGLGFLVMDVDSLDPVRYAKARPAPGGGRPGAGMAHLLLRERVRYILSHPTRPYCVAQTILLDGKPEYTEEEFVAWTGGLRADEVRYKFLDSFRGQAAQKGGLGPDDLCREPFYGFTVHANGDVVPCDRDWAGENVMGNVVTQTVSEIWHGDRFTAFRAAMLSREKPAMCRGCPEGKLVNLRSQPMVQVNMFRGAEVYHK